jgi:anti-sigma B factor antagonist
MSVLFDVQRRERDGWTVLAVTGELDLAAAPRVRHAVLQVVPPLFARPPAEPPRVVIDLASVEFLDSAGLGVVLGAVRRARAAGGTAAVVVASAPVRDLFVVLGLPLVIPVRSSLDEVLADAAAGDLEPPGSPVLAARAVGAGTPGPGEGSGTDG